MIIRGSIVKFIGFSLGTTGALIALTQPNWSFAAKLQGDYATMVFKRADYPQDTFTQLRGINNTNVIAGIHGNPVNQGFTMKRVQKIPTFTDKNKRTAEQTRVNAINNAGKIAGSFVKNGITHGFIRGVEIGAKFIPMDMPNTAYNEVLGLNDLNLAVGFSSVDTTGNLQQRAFFYNGIKFKDLTGKLPTSLTGFNSQATGINNGKWICGFFETQPGFFSGFLLHGKSVITLNYPGAISTQTWGINNLGMVVGEYADVNGVIHGFAYDNNNGIYYGPFDAGFGKNTHIHGVSDISKIVGFTDDNGVNVGFTSKLN